MDSNGQLVGFPWVLYGYSYTARLVSGNWFALQALPGGFRQGATFYNDSMDCLGTDYVQAIGSQQFASYQVGSIGTILYFAPQIDGTIRQIHSIKFWNGTQLQCQFFEDEIGVVVPIALDASTFGLVPPFSLSQ